jgi:CBS domain-containing protein
MHAAEIMTRNVITATPKTEVREIVDLMIKNRISAVPVVDDGGRVIGMVSEGDLMRRVENNTERRDSWWLAALFSARNDADSYVKSHGRRAEDVMTREPITISEDTPLYKIAQTLEKNHIKRVPVVTNGKLVGIVSRSNLLQGFSTTRSSRKSRASWASPATPPTSSWSTAS